MASFVIHNIAGERLFELLEKKYGVSFSEEERDEFLLANLIVDSSKLKFSQEEGMTLEEAKKRFREMVQDEKVATHFRNDDDIDLCIQVPNLDKFENKYGHLLKDSMSVLGYLFHLYTDKLFFENLFTATFDTLDKDMEPTIYTKETKFMRVKKNNKLYSIDEFWNSGSKTGIYYDYTVMNRILLEYYGSSFDKDRLVSNALMFVNPGIEEVDFNNIISIIEKTSSFISQSYDCEDDNLNIFDKDMVIRFIDDIAVSFIDRYMNVFELDKNIDTKMCRRLIKIDGRK